MTLSRVHSWSTGSSPKRILIDSMIVDKILETRGLIERIQQAGAQGVLVIVETHVLREQLSDTPNEAKRRQLLEVYEALPKDLVPTSAFVLDVSPLVADVSPPGGAEPADEATAASVDRLKTPSKDSGGIKDALLAATASGKADVLVTEDTGLLKRVPVSPLRCEVWDFARFRQFVEDTPAK